MLYVLVEWCIQAHLSTEDYDSAMNGLWRVRRFRRFTLWLRYPATLLVMAVNQLARRAGLRKSGKTKTLIWSKECRHSLGIGHAIVQASGELHALPFREEHRPRVRRNAASVGHEAERNDAKEKLGKSEMM